VNIYLLNFETPEQLQFSLNCDVSCTDMHNQFVYHLKQSAMKHCKNAEVIHKELAFSKDEVEDVVKRVKVLHKEMFLTKGFCHKIGTNFLKLKRQAEIAQNESSNFVFMDTDMLFTGDIAEAFKYNFDIAFTKRRYKNPINGGMVLGKPGKGGEIYSWWYQIADRFMSDPDLFLQYFPKYLGICQSSIGYMLEQGIETKYKVQYFPCTLYNSTRVGGWEKGIDKDVKCLHFNHRSIREYLVAGIVPEDIKRKDLDRISREYFQYKSIPHKKEIHKFEQSNGYFLNLKNPETFNEKVEYKKYNDRNPLIEYTSDKIKVREYVKEKGLSSILTNVLWEGDRITPADIQKGVLKANHGSGWLTIVDGTRGKNEICDIANRWMDLKYGIEKGEWGYFNISPRLLIEEMPDGVPISKNIKALCFHGEVKYFLYYEFSFDKNIGKTVVARQLYDYNWNLQTVKMAQKDVPIKDIPKPEELSNIIRYSRILSEPFDFVRCDFMQSESGKIFFSELTHYPSSAHFKFSPIGWDRRLGSFWNLSKY